MIFVIQTHYETLHNIVT